MNERIALIVGTNLHWAPFYYRYEKYLGNKGIRFDLILWNREGIYEPCLASNIIECNTRDVANNKNPKKIWKFVMFADFVKKVVKHNKYDKLIFVGTYGCAIAFGCNYFSKHYKNKIWIDIRDDLYEWFKPFYLAEKKSIDASFATTISSPAFRIFLPEHNYYMMHNIDPNAGEMAMTFKKNEDPEGRIRISFIGNVRYFEQNVMLLNCLKNDKRFQVQYYGNGSEQIERYCSEQKIYNVDFYGGFEQKDTVKFYEKTDIINNMYGNGTMNLRLALSNKLYYGVYLKLPILVSSNTLMEELTSQYEMGYTFANTNTFADDLYEWYQNIQKGIIVPKYEKLLARIQREDTECLHKLDEFLAL